MKSIKNIKIKGNPPLVSVVMSCYNRQDYVKDAIESILNQTYTDFEFIIIDDCSTDNTAKIIKSYAEQDKRIVFIRNKRNMGICVNRRKHIELAKGKYIATMDDDDIALPQRFSEQIKFLDTHPGITVLGTFIELENPEKIKFDNWVKETDPARLAVLLNFINPLCAPSVMMRTDFLHKHAINYNTSGTEDYFLWSQIILHGGKLGNLPKVLLRYRVHAKSITQKADTGQTQRILANHIKLKLLRRFFGYKQCREIIRHTIYYPLTDNYAAHLFNILENMKNTRWLSNQAINEIQKEYCGQPCTMEIFFSADNNYAQHLVVTLASILVNSLKIENFNFYILDGGISDRNKKKLLKLKKLKPFNIEFIKIDNALFKNCPITSSCQHISKSTYYRYILSTLKPHLDKCLYLDCDVVVEDSLNKLWHTDLSNNYIAAVEDLYMDCVQDKERLGTRNYFNAGILLINNKLWRAAKIEQKLFKNTDYLARKNAIRWVDQDVLNYTFNSRILPLDPKYNLQQNAFYDGQHSLYSDEQIAHACWRPSIIHFNGITKPWTRVCHHHFWRKYYKYLRLTPYKREFYQWASGYICSKLKPAKIIDKAVILFFPPNSRRRVFLKKAYSGFIKIKRLIYKKISTDDYNIYRFFYILKIRKTRILSKSELITTIGWLNHCLHHELKQDFNNLQAELDKIKKQSRQHE
jgi:lipopolysaccharide biosynthesis glycosyltransferase